MHIKQAAAVPMLRWMCVKRERAASEMYSFPSNQDSRNKWDNWDGSVMHEKDQ